MKDCNDYVEFTYPYEQSLNIYNYTAWLNQVKVHLYEIQFHKMLESIYNLQVIAVYNHIDNTDLLNYMRYVFNLLTYEYMNYFILAEKNMAYEYIYDIWNSINCSKTSSRV